MVRDYFKISELNSSEKITLSKNHSFELPYNPPANKLINDWPCFALTKENQILAYVSFEIHPPHKNTLWIQNICIIENHKRMGLGRKLVKFSINYAKINNYKEVALYAHKTEALIFWKSIGFKKVGKAGESLIFKKRVIN